MVLVANAITIVLRLYEFLILIRVLLSWVSVGSSGMSAANPLVSLLIRLTEPVLGPLRRLIPSIGGALDISPAVALILIELLRMALVTILVRL